MSQPCPAQLRTSTEPGRGRLGASSECVEQRRCRSLLPRVGGVQSRQIWDASDPLPQEDAVSSAPHASQLRRAR
jgi:hypothetical protein